MDSIDNYLQLGNTHSILKNLITKRTLLRVSVPTLPDTIYTTSVIEASHEQNRLEIDELFPAIEPELLTPGMEIEIHSSSRTSDLCFKVVVTEHSNDTIVTNFPEDISHTQNRRDYRVQLTQGQELYALVTTQKLGAMNGRIIDISTRGVCLDLDHRGIMKIPEDTIIPDVKIELTEGELECSLRVCSVNRGIIHSSYIMRCEFKRISRFEQARLEREILKLQRQQIRSSRKLHFKK